MLTRLTIKGVDEIDRVLTLKVGCGPRRLRADVDWEKTRWLERVASLFIAAVKIEFRSSWERWEGSWGRICCLGDRVLKAFPRPADGKAGECAKPRI